MFGRVDLMYHACTGSPMPMHMLQYLLDLCTDIPPSWNFPGKGKKHQGPLKKSSSKPVHCTLLWHWGFRLCSFWHNRVWTIEAPTLLRKTAFGGGAGPPVWFWFCCSVIGGAFCLTSGKAENWCGKKHLPAQVVLNCRAFDLALIMSHLYL